MTIRGVKSGNEDEYDCSQDSSKPSQSNTVTGGRFSRRRFLRFMWPNTTIADSQCMDALLNSLCFLLHSCLNYINTSSADADKPACRIWRSVKVTKHSTIPYVRYSFLLCNSNFLFIRLQKMLWPWNGVKGHSRSLRVVLLVYGFLLVFFSNFVPKMHGFWDIRLQKCRDLENRVRGASRSLEMSPCNRAHMISYCRSRSIVTMALSCVVSEIFSVKNVVTLKSGVKGHSWSLRVVSFDRLCMVSY